MAVSVCYLTDPACPWSWSIEPAVRRLMVEFGDGLSWTFVMAGLARDFAAPPSGEGWGPLVGTWLDASDSSEMPVDPRLWLEGPLSSSYPACMAVKAAQQQAIDGGYKYLRALREGILCFRRKLDHGEALVQEARGVSLDAARFRVDLGSHATVEAFGADLEIAGTWPTDGHQSRGSALGPGGERLIPSLRFVAADSSEMTLTGIHPYSSYRQAAETAGARRQSASSLSPVECVEHFGRAAAAEVAAVCGLPTPRAQFELWSLVCEWKLKAVRTVAGWLFELA